MDMGTIGASWLKAKGILTNLDESDEINACTVRVTVDVDGRDEDWLFLFKNETHNHPTEIEPFGGAATCIGGAIRDPLSGRAYVYQAMRVTGAADPLVPVSQTMRGKLPQRKLVCTAAEGYSSYGNQVGLATGQVFELYHAGYAAKRLEDMRRDFVANVSHELKTPVGAIQLLAETVEAGADDPDFVRDYSGRMRKEACRLGVLVQEIIELTRLQEGDALAEPEVVDIDDVVAEAVDRVRVEADGRQIALVSGGTKGLRVRGDAALITTAVRNLLDNAIRYSEPRTRVSVGVSLDAEDPDIVRIAVVDQGIGIPKEEQERVFERFYRVDKARSRATGGTGLGLSIVKHVAADHGGTVLLSSHLLHEVQQIADEIVMIGQGRIVASGTQEELLKTTDDLEELFLDLTESTSREGALS